MNCLPNLAMILNMEEKDDNELCLINGDPAVMNNVDVSHVDPSQIVNIAHVEGQILMSYTNEPDCEALAFPKKFWTGQFHFNFKREILGYSRRNPVTVARQIGCTFRKLWGKVILGGMQPVGQIFKLW